MIIRRATIEDSQFLFLLRNEKSVRESAFNTEPITVETHNKWFAKKVNSDLAIILIGEVEGGEKIGQVRFDIDPSNNSAEIDIAVVVRHRGKGFGPDLLKQGCIYVWQTHRVSKFIAYVKKINQNSIQIFIKAGFKSTAFTKQEGYSCVKMEFAISEMT